MELPSLHQFFTMTAAWLGATAMINVAIAIRTFKDCLNKLVKGLFSQSIWEEVEPQIAKGLTHLMWFCLLSLVSLAWLILFSN